MKVLKRFSLFLFNSFSPIPLLYLTLVYTNEGTCTHTYVRFIHIGVKKEKGRERGRDRSRERGRDKSRERGRDRSRERGRDKSRERGRNRSRERAQDRSRERDQDQKDPQNGDRCVLQLGSYMYSTCTVVHVTHVFLYTCMA